MRGLRGRAVLLRRVPDCTLARTRDPVQRAEIAIMVHLSLDYSSVYTYVSTYYTECEERIARNGRSERCKGRYAREFGSYVVKFARR